MEQATNFMTLRGQSWDPLCCVNKLGACQGCGDSVLAYVTSWNYVGDDETTHNGTYVRICKKLLDEPEAT
jgi:hypothetical protein